MRIHIKNFRSIDELEYAVEDNALNVLYGVCGTGKSSLLEALANPWDANDVRIGSSEETPEVEVDGKERCMEMFALYNQAEQDVLFKEVSDGQFYRVFVGDASELNLLVADYDAAIERLREHKDVLYGFIKQIEEAKSKLGKPSGKEKKLSEKTKFMSCAKMMQSASDSARSVLGDISQPQINWINDGLKFIDADNEEECPFCGQAMEADAKSRIDGLRELNKTTLKTFYESSSLLENLGIREPDWNNEEEVNKVKESLEELYSIEAEVRSLIDLIEQPRTTETMKKEFEEIKLSRKAIERFPELEEVVNGINSNSTEVKKLLGQMSSSFERLIQRNSSSLNEKLRVLGIPYFFGVIEADRSENKAKYVLMHRLSNADNNASGNDMRNKLSFGERNLIALLLFLKNREEPILLIDDPASSYDDYRRSQIYKLLLETKGKTIIAASHDQAFMRFAVRDKDKDKSKLGCIQQLTRSKGRMTLVDISFDSFVNISDTIKGRVAKSKSYYQKVINTRLYIDLHGASKTGSIWGYTSKLLHRESRENIEEYLNGRNTTEDNVIEELKQLGLDLPPFDENYDLDKNELSDFEHLIISREELKTKKGDAALTKEEEVQLKLLNDLVHMNNCMSFCLDPYRYKTWAPMLDDILFVSDKSDGTNG